MLLENLILKKLGLLALVSDGTETDQHGTGTESQTDDTEHDIETTPPSKRHCNYHHDNNLDISGELI